MTLVRKTIVPDQVLKQQASAFKINLLDFEVPSKDLWIDLGLSDILKDKFSCLLKHLP